MVCVNVYSLVFFLFVQTKRHQFCHGAKIHKKNDLYTDE